jgi:hypothetical protein
MRSGRITQIRYREAGTGGAYTTVPANVINNGASGPTPDSPREAMASGAGRRVGHRYSFSLPIKQAGKISAFKSMWTAPAGQTAATNPTTTPANWTEHGRIDAGGSFQFTPVVRNDAGLVRLYFRMDYRVTFDILDDTQYNDLEALDGTVVDIALERLDGTYLVLHNVLFEVDWNPAMGAERFQTSRVMLSGSEVDIADMIESAATTYFAGLNTLQTTQKRLEIEFTYDDGSIITLPEAGFSVTPLIPFGQEELEGILLEGNGYGPTRASVITVSPAFS